ncbi:hypothetical protein SCLCIDRAFT_325080 [Scleroderma citrinum Foug A]|uniref:Uncharacterized protein n=1 Tax=Scleroderma citrinum Foug A TaxID=1036808 RepID=A0A0C3EDS2_9AGAM|nr:hypothetical protein SCLCIDRAFT_325080 [Scleroderma citrinum Foug A]
MPPMWSKCGNDNGSWNKLSTTTPLTQFELIRNHFRVLVYSHPPSQPEYDEEYHSFGTAVEPVVCKQVATSGGGAEEGETAMRFFRGIFGGVYFKDQIGDISLVELRKAVGGDQIESLEKSMKEPSSVHQVHHVDVETIEMEVDSRIEFLADSLLKKMSMTIRGVVDPNAWLVQKTKMYHEAEGLRSKSFGAEIVGTWSKDSRRKMCRG